MIKKIDDKWYVYSEDGSKELGGPYTSREAAEDRLREVEYFKHKNKEIFSANSIIELKEESDSIVVKGFIATTHIDSGDGKVRDKITRPTLVKWAKELNEGVPRANKSSWHHVRSDKRVVGVAVKGTAKVVDFTDGESGLYVETIVNKTHPDFESIAYELKNGMTDSFSIEYIAPQDAQTMNGVRILDLGTELHGYTLASRPMNENCVMIKELYNSSKQEDEEEDDDEEEHEDNCSCESCKKKKAKMASDSNSNKSSEKLVLEEKQMDADITKLQAELTAKESLLAEKEAQLKEFVAAKSAEEAAKQKAIAEKEAVEKKEVDKKEMLSSLLESKEFNAKLDALAKKVPMETKEGSELSIETKQYIDAMSNKESTVEQQLTSAFALAEKESKLIAAKEGVEARHERVGAKNFSVNGSKIQFKALGVGSNVNSTYVNATSSVGINAAELQDLVDPVLYNALNNATKFFGRVMKENKSSLGSNRYTFVLQTGRNPTAGAYTGDAVSTANSARTLYTTKFKKYQVGVSVSGELIAANRGSPLGEVLALETAQAMADLMKVLNTDIFTEQGLETSSQIIGLKYISDSAGNTSLYGVTRSDANKLAPSAAGNTYISGAAGISKSLLRQAITNILVDGGDRASIKIVMTPAQLDKLKSQEDNALRYVPLENNIGFGVNISFEGCEIIEDVDCPSASAFVLDMNAFKVAFWIPPTFEYLGKRNDSVEGFVKTYLASYSNAPRRVVEIYSLP